MLKDFGRNFFEKKIVKNVRCMCMHLFIEELLSWKCKGRFGIFLYASIKKRMFKQIHKVCVLQENKEFFGTFFC